MVYAQRTLVSGRHLETLGLFDEAGSGELEELEDSDSNFFLKESSRTSKARLVTSLKVLRHLQSRSSLETL